MPLHLLYWLSGFEIKLQKNDLNCFWKEIKNGHEIKETEI